MNSNTKLNSIVPSMIDVEKFQNMELLEQQKREQFFSQHSPEHYYHTI